ncbi:MAG: 50S ribosomal protein L17 [Pseudomonadota bacterium]
MRHRVAGRTFGRRSDQRKAMFRGLATALVDHGRIQTTIQKAKELRRVVEPLVTLAKRGNLHACRQAAAFLYGDEVVRKLFGEIAPRLKDRPGGYTRIYKLNRRRGDGAEMALIELLGTEKKKPAKKTPSEKKAEKKKADLKDTNEPKALSKEAKAVPKVSKEAKTQMKVSPRKKTDK